MGRCGIRPYYGGDEYDTGEPFLIIYDPVYLITIMAISTTATHRVQITRAGTQTTNNTLSYQVHYRQIGTTGDWTATDAVTAVGQTVDMSYLLQSSGTAISTFSDLLGYEFQLVVSDRFASSTALAEIPTKDIMMHIKRAEKSVAFGMESTGTTDEAKFEVAQKAYFYGGIEGANVVYTSGSTPTGNTWVDGKPIYRYVYFSTSVLNRRVTHTLATLTGMDTVLSINGTFSGAYSEAQKPLPFNYYYSANDYTKLEISNTGVVTFYSQYYDAYKTTVIIEYTKTT